MNVGADWGLLNDVGLFSPDVRVQLRTNDGANLYVTSIGHQQTNGLVNAHTTFETGSGAYYWLNNVVGISLLIPHVEEGYIAVEVYQVSRGCMIKRGFNVTNLSKVAP